MQAVHQVHAVCWRLHCSLSYHCSSCVLHIHCHDLWAQIVDTSEMWIRKLNELVEHKVIPPPAAGKAGGK